MAKSGDKIWILKTDLGVRVYAKENDARRDYMRLVDFYKNHKPDDYDKRTFEVWNEVNDGEDHHIFVEAKYGEITQNFCIYYCIDYIK